MMTQLAARLRRFQGDESGSYTVETVLVLPLLVWACLLYTSDAADE